MKNLPHIVLLGSFLAIIFGVPLFQALYDIKGEQEDKPLALTLFDQPPTEKHLRDYEKLLEESSIVEQKIRPQFQLGRYLVLREMGEKALRGVPGWTFYHPGVKYLTEPYYTQGHPPPATDPLVAIGDFHRQLRAKGIELLVIPLPGKASIYPDRLVSSAKPALELTAHTQRFIGQLRQRAIPVLNLHQTFLHARASQPQGPSLYMASDTHWTGEGIRLAAETIARWVRARPWFGRAAGKPLYARRPLRVTRRGDIPKMTQIPMQEKLFPNEKVTCLRVTRLIDGQPYAEPQDPAGPQILLLGDSFSRIFQTDSPGAAGLIANLAYELQQPLSSIVNDGGASTLVRQELARTPELLANKRLVIWTFVERDIRVGLQGWQLVPLDTPPHQAARSASVPMLRRDEKP